MRCTHQAHGFEIRPGIRFYRLLRQFSRKGINKVINENESGTMRNMQ